MPRDIGCKRCPLSLGVQNVCVWGEGKTGGVMVVGEAPGADEDMLGKPFVGAAGKELTKHLEAVGRSRSDVYVSNAVKCRPPGNRTPLQAELNACFTHLAEEISAVQPKVILCLGGAALKALTGKEAVAANRGKPVMAKPNVRVGDAQIYVTYHPAATMHNRNVVEQRRIKESIQQDLTLAFSLAGMERKETKDHRKALLAEPYTPGQMKKRLDVLRKCRVVACDLEWTALKDRGMSWPWTKGAELYTISLSGRLNDGSIASLAFSWPPPPDAMPDLEEFFSKMPLVFHNALADLNWLYYLGLKVKLGGDTLVLAYLMDEEQRLSLDQLAPLYTDVAPGWKVGPWDKRPKTKEGWLEILTYNADDTYATLKLAEALHKKLESMPAYERDGIKRVYYRLLLPVIPTFVRMALRGIPMDVDAVAREYAASHDRSKALSQEMAELIGCTPAQAAAIAGSPSQTMKYLKAAYNLEIDSSNKEDLSLYEAEYPLIKLIQAYRWERNKVQGTYVGPWLELLKEQGDAALHSVYRITYARTGRTSAEIEKGGSLQLMPRNQKGRELRARDLVRAKPGWKIVSADYSQIELRVMAWFSEDPVMIQLYKEGADLHAATAAFIKAGLPLGTFWPRRDEFISLVTKEERQGAKGVNFGLIFGLQPEGLMDYARLTYGVDMSYEQAVKAHNDFFRMYQGIDHYHQYCRTEVFSRGYTETPFGRFRRSLEDPNKAINTPVQATASDMTLFAAHNIDVAFERTGWPAHVVGFVHDSVLCHVREDYVDDARKVIRREMEDIDLLQLGVESLPLPLVADIVVGDTWGEAE